MTESAVLGHSVAQLRSVHIHTFLPVLWRVGAQAGFRGSLPDRQGGDRSPPARTQCRGPAAARLRLRGPGSMKVTF